MSLSEKAFTDNRRKITDNRFSRVNPCQRKCTNNNVKDTKLANGAFLLPHRSHIAASSSAGLIQDYGQEAFLFPILACNIYGQTC